MDWINWLIPMAIIIVLIMFRRLGVVSAAKAKDLIAKGAKVIDVRTPGEFASDPVPGASNLPLNELAHRVEREFPDKQTPLLVHCLSGGRSALAARLLRQKGFQAYNLGGVRRAARIVGRRAG